MSAYTLLPRRMVEKMVNVVGRRGLALRPIGIQEWIGWVGVQEWVGWVGVQEWIGRVRW